MSESNHGGVSIQDDLASVQTLIDKCSDGIKKLYALQDAMKELGQEIESEKAYDHNSFERMKILMRPVNKIRKAEHDAAGIFMEAFRDRSRDVCFLQRQAEEQILKSAPPEVKSAIAEFFKKFHNKQN